MALHHGQERPRRPRLKIRSMQMLAHELKNKIIKALNLENVTPADIQDGQPLFGTGLGLDSIDALDLVSMLERDYGILIQDMEVARQAFASCRSLVDFVQNHRQ
jgi:acyl carrier protein